VLVGTVEIEVGSSGAVASGLNISVALPYLKGRYSTEQVEATLSYSGSEVGVVLAQPETQVIVPRDDEPAHLPIIVDSTPSEGTPQL